MLLLDYYYDELPTENQLSTVFQLTVTQSRTLLKNFNSKYRTRILAKARAAKRAVVHSAQIGQGKHLFIGTSQVIIDELNDLIRKTHPDILPIVRDTDASGKYSCGGDTYNTLIALFP